LFQIIFGTLKTGDKSITITCNVKHD